MDPLILDFGEVEALSLDLLSSLEANEVPIGVAAAALLLSALRILSPIPLDDDEQVQMTQEALEWAVLRTMPVSGTEH